MSAMAECIEYLNIQISYNNNNKYIDLFISQHLYDKKETQSQDKLTQTERKKNSIEKMKKSKTKQKSGQYLFNSKKLVNKQTKLNKSLIKVL